MLCALLSRPLRPVGLSNAGVMTMTLCDQEQQLTPQSEVQHLLQRLAEVPEEAPATQLLLGRKLEGLGLLNEAMTSFNEVLEAEASTDEQCSRASLGLGRIMADELEAPAEAESALIQSVTLDSECHEGWAALGRLRYRFGALSDAREALEAAVRRSPNDPSYRADFAKALRAQGAFDDARAEYAKAAELGARRSELDQALSYYLADRPGKEEEEEARRSQSVPAEAVEPALEIPANGLFVPSEWKPRLSGVYLTDVATAAECEWVIAEAERSVASAGGEGWSADGHHDRFQTRDMVVADNEALTEWLNGKLREVIWPALAAQFGLNTSELWLQDAFVVRYEPDGQRGLAPHLDDSELSFNIALSDPDAFSGGGTSFEATGQTLRPQQGQMVSHFGRVFHAGEPVTSGTRHILAGFVCARSLAREWRDLRPQAGQRVDVHGEQ